jgi:hypothetical protein
MEKRLGRVEALFLIGIKEDNEKQVRKIPTLKRRGWGTRTKSIRSACQESSVSDQPKS